MLAVFMLAAILSPPESFDNCLKSRVCEIADPAPGEHESGGQTLFTATKRGSLPPPCNRAEHESNWTVE
jgi:hypothetical protein